MAKNIMLAFVSVVSDYRLKNPIYYKDIQGAPFSAIQTNESAIAYVERMLNKKSDTLSKIFLIVSDKVKTEFAVNEITHLEFLKQRLVKEFPQLENKFSEQDYSEGNENLEKNILQIGEIANAVTDYAKNFPAEKIIVNADMTGGFRHTSMLMLSIIQLLKYRGVEIGEILYSDPDKKIVYPVNEIQKTFTLITGADEFVKFGSVEALQEYFGENPNAATNELLNAMKRFSEAIKVCHTSAIKDELKNLGKHIKIFRKNEIKDVQSELFAKIIDTVETEYGKLIGGNAGSLDIIRWCMKKGFWQQAMTLCTEWLPEEIIDRKIFYPANEDIIDAAEKEGVPFGRGWKQHFIIAYKNQEKAHFDEKSLKKFRYALQNPMTENLPENSDKFTKFLQEYLRGQENFVLSKKGLLWFNVFREKYPCLYEVLHSLYIDNPAQKTFKEFFKSLKYDKILLRLAALDSEKLVKIFNIKNLPIVKSTKSKWENRAAMYGEMLKSGVAKTDFKNAEKILEILKGYYKIRQERNHLNHANSVERMKISDIEQMISDYLIEIEKFNEVIL